MNQPPQGWQQPPPGYGYPPQQPKKSKAPLVIGLIFGVLVLAGVITGLVIHLNVNSDSGTAKRSDKLPELCGNVSEAALAKARTTNPVGRGSSESESSSGKRTVCTWNMTKGVDGTGHRTTTVYIESELDDAESDFDRALAQNMANNQGVPQQKALDGLGDEATVVLVETKSAFTEISVIVRKGDAVIEVDLAGWDAGFFSNQKPDVAEIEAATKGIAEEMVAKM